MKEPTRSSSQLRWCACLAVVSVIAFAWLQPVFAGGRTKRVPVFTPLVDEIHNRFDLEYRAAGDNVDSKVLAYEHMRLSWVQMGYQYPRSRGLFIGTMAKSARMAQAILYAGAGRYAEADTVFRSLAVPGTGCPDLALWFNRANLFVVRDLYLYRETCKAVGNHAGVAAVRAVTGQIVVRSPVVTHTPVSKTASEMVSAGFTRDEVLDFAAGLHYINSGEDGEVGLARGKALVTAVADAHPTNAFVNFCLSKSLGPFAQNEKYTRRAFRYGSQAMRDELLSGGRSIENRWANQEAKRMGLPYDHTRVPRKAEYTTLPDGTHQDTITELPDTYVD